ncbi:MAG: ERF family protein [Bacillus sp. (in: firmicutes)]
MSETNKSLVKKLSEVMRQVKYIEKKGFNKFHKYKYATESDVAEKVREVLADQNVMMVPNLLNHTTREHTTAAGKTEYIVSVDMEFNFYDGDSGEHIAFRMSGDGQDAGDKAIYKAITGAQKYALMKVFMIPTGDDPEADSGTDDKNESPNSNNNQSPSKNAPMASDKQLNFVNKLLKDVSTAKNITEDEAYKTLKKHMKKDMEWFTADDASDAIQLLSNSLKKGA